MPVIRQLKVTAPFEKLMAISWQVRLGRMRAQPGARQLAKTLTYAQAYSARADDVLAMYRRHEEERRR